MTRREALALAALRHEEAVPKSALCRRLEAAGLILQDPEWWTWCASPIETPDGRVHVFYSRWRGVFGDWLHSCEIAHAVAGRPEGPYRYVNTVLRGRGGGHWDSDTVHNPTIHRVGRQYVLLYIGNHLAGTDLRNVVTHPASRQRIGIAISDSIDGPFERPNGRPLLDVTPDPAAWDSYLVTNPALLAHPSGEFWLYYKAWDRRHDGFRKIGLAKSERVEGPYRKHPGNPVVDFSRERKQVEDPYVYRSAGKYYMLLADDNEGVLKKHAGLLLESEDGERWSNVTLGYDTSDAYFGGDTLRFERPQVLMRRGAPAYLFLAVGGSAGRKSCAAVLRVR
ncbi:MAG: glycoside hydrolase family protein [Bryobacteraceae bacterium]